MRPTKQLNDHKRIEPCAQEIPIIFCGNVFGENPVVGGDTSGKIDEIEKKIEVKEKQEEGRDREECDQGQFRGKDWQLDRRFLEKCEMIDRSCGADQIARECHEVHTQGRGA